MPRGFMTSCEAARAAMTFEVERLRKTGHQRKQQRERARDACVAQAATHHSAGASIRSIAGGSARLMTAWR